MKLKKFLGIMVSISLLMGVVGCANTENTLGATENKSVINLGVTPYPHIDLITEILELSLGELGYETERVEGDVGFMYLGMSQGDIDIYPDGWLPILHGNYIDKYGDRLEVGNTIYEQVTMGIVVPTYVDINSIQELKDNAEIFDNKIVGIEPSAGIMLTASETIDAYGMDNIELLEGSTPAMLAEVDNAVRAEEPIAFLGWRPHIMFSEYDLKVLEDDMDIWDFDDVRSVMNPELKEKSPEAYELIQNFKISIDDIEDILFKLEQGENSLEELSAEWLANNRGFLDEILEQGVASK
ncbi:MAG: glycine betaine ABC transporter substrate-binding protein [Epulopiscium sp.]|nr:glycine betaine ABC transporter substrate-binding protein [Candidatus Epulonipiscium sp.]